MIMIYYLGYLVRTRKLNLKLKFSPGRRWQIMPVRPSATRKKLNILVYLTQKNRTILTYCSFILMKFVLFVLPLHHIGNVFLYLDLYRHGKVGPEACLWQGGKIVGSNKICPKKVHISSRNRRGKE